MNDDPVWRVWWRRVFAAFLALSFVIGLYLSYRPAGFSDEPEVASDEQETAAPDDEEPGEAQETETQAPPDDEAEDEDEETEDEPMTEEEAQAFIEAARDPEETSVQVLDAGGGSTATNSAADALRDLGYDVIAVNSSRTDYDITTVLFTRGNKPEAQGLRAREERVTVSAPNERLSDAVDLHLVVGPDWED